ncbi:Regulator of nonsense transcripts 1-like [Gracilariopsis chorda]|uniref:Regulator of nonsense transcripts 1-like n=1 Tax=Gracilariopsis chorda TaxID=448386 RepID=A0A2V3IMP2_9FLOR|nr:Regulator of nonsense transcripts 1-like [Gracilariopsis chorda]|eukprot:PXF43348.1 Regulator of nonsense transcripts 1-like [Gracilariopsis chorda]
MKKGRPQGRGRSAKRQAFHSAMEAYNKHFRPLLDAEVAAEQEQMRQLRSEDSGNMVKLHGLAIRREKRIFAEVVYSLQSRKALPQSRFGKGDLVDIHYETESVQALILSRQSRKLFVTASIGSEAADRLDSYAALAKCVHAEAGINTLSYERAVKALDFVSKGTPLSSDTVRLLIMSIAATQDHLYLDLQTKLSATELASRHLSDNKNMWEQIAGETVGRFRDEDANLVIRQLKPRLNRSQIRTIRKALQRRFTLVQGPPGTGKTFMASHLISCILQLNIGPVLACAGTNVATDNLMRNILKTCPKAKVVRLGRVSAVQEDLWNMSLDGLLERNKQVRKARRDVEQGLNVNLRALEKVVAHDILRSADVIVATCVGSGRDEIKDFKFSFVIIDEATQVTEPDTLIPFSFSNDIASQCVLIGDHCQLPPTVLSTTSLSNTEGLGISMFLRLWLAGVGVQLLDTQYRMHPSIASFPCAHFYSGLLRDGVRSEDRVAPKNLSDEAIRLFSKGRSFFCNVENGVEESVSTSRESGKVGTSLLNHSEAQAVVKLVALLEPRTEGKALVSEKTFRTSDIGIISPYEGQVRLLHDMIAQGENSDMKISTVDSFQGQERDVILVSAVRSNMTGQVGFLKDWRRLNVSITRARLLLVVVGNEETLMNDVHWKAWIRAQPRLVI